MTPRLQAHKDLPRRKPAQSRREDCQKDCCCTVARAVVVDKEPQRDLQQLVAAHSQPAVAHRSHSLAGRLAAADKALLAAAASAEYMCRSVCCKRYFSRKSCSSQTQSSFQSWHFQHHILGSSTDFGRLLPVSAPNFPSLTQCLCRLSFLPLAPYLCHLYGRGWCEL